MAERIPFKIDCGSLLSFAKRVFTGRMQRITTLRLKIRQNQLDFVKIGGTAVFIALLSFDSGALFFYLTSQIVIML